MPATWRFHERQLALRVWDDVNATAGGLDGFNRKLSPHRHFSSTPAAPQTRIPGLLLKRTPGCVTFLAAGGERTTWYISSCFAHTHARTTDATIPTRAAPGSLDQAMPPGINRQRRTRLPRFSPQA